MVTALVLLTVVSDRVGEVAEELAALKGISEVHSVAGRYDLVAILRVRDNASLADLVTDQIRKVRGITSSETLIGFRAYSRHDLDGIFSIGLE